MTATTGEIKRMASLVLAICISGPGAALAQADSANEQLLNLVLQVQQLQDEVRQLRGLVEEQAFELESIKRRQRDQYLDLDQRISELGDGQPARSDGARVEFSAAEPDASEPAPTVLPPPADVPEVREPIDNPSTVTGIGVPTVASRDRGANPQQEQAAYDQAFQALKELRYADAAGAFQDFIDNYPESDLADNANYWLGESYYVTRNYEIALDVFQRLVRDFPDSPKAGDGLLKIGFTHYELKQWDQARAALEQVQRQYPDSTLSRLAESRLRSMRLEGHF